MAVEGEIVDPDVFDDLARRLDEAYRSGQFGQHRLASLGRRQLQNPDWDSGRAMAAALGGSIGSTYRWLGAGAGAAIAVLLWELAQHNNTRMLIQQNANTGRIHRPS